MAFLKRDGVAHSDSQVKANILNNQFSSVFTKEDTSTIPSLYHSTHPDLARITVSKQGVQKLLGGLLRSTLLLALMKYRLGYPRSMLASSPLPWPWYSKPHSIRVHYQPLGSKPGLYRSSRKGRELVHPTTGCGLRLISLTCISCKCLEHIIHSNIIDHLDNNEIL